MPDHQIVIKLDKDQFDEAQRLAKLAGFRSASSYIRERVVSIIKNGEEGNELEALIPNLPRRIKNIDNDLSRIQHELQLFISETDLTPIPVESIVEKQVSTESSFENQLSFTEFNDKTGATIDLDDATYDTTKKNSDSDLVITDEIKKEAVERDPVDPDESAHEKEKSVWQSGDKTSDTTPSETEVQPDSSYKESMPAVEEAVQAAEVANDELEEMADRAFSISPRLGALDPSRGPNPLSDDDPLADLLDEHLVDKLITPAGMDFEPEPQKASEEPQQEEEEKTEVEAKAVPEKVEKPQPEPEPEGETLPKETEPKEKKKKKPEAEKDSSPEVEPADSAESKSDESTESKTDKKDEEEEEDAKKHDLSGGPPPKRRKK